jgi:hypothetical protein
MSTTYSIACRDCKKHLWIAQGRKDGSGHLYSGAEAIGGLYKFLREHQGHSLIFDENCEGEIGEWEEDDLS